MLRKAYPKAPDQASWLLSPALLPPKSKMNSRRLIVAPDAKDETSYALNLSNRRGGSALGQKRTFRSAITMSALPPKADICGATRDVR